MNSDIHTKIIESIIKDKQKPFFSLSRDKNIARGKRIDAINLTFAPKFI